MNLLRATDSHDEAHLAARLRTHAIAARQDAERWAGSTWGPLRRRDANWLRSQAEAIEARRFVSSAAGDCL